MACTGTIRLTNGEIDASDTVTIDGAGLITVTGDAADDDVTTTGDITDVAASCAGLLDDNSRIFNASANLMIDGLTLTGGRTTGTYDGGGAITILNSTISGNSTAGDFANGGPVAKVALRADASNPALDAAAAGGADARGEARGADFAGVDNGGASDLGAFELQFDEDDAPPVLNRNLALLLGEGLSAALSL